jgi:hypothetical protein
MLTVFLDILLVAVTAGNLVLQSFGILDDLLNSENPAVAFLGGGGLEAMLVSAGLEGELVESFLGNQGSVGLIWMSVVFNLASLLNGLPD